MRRFTSLAPRSGMVKRNFTFRQREGHEEILRAIAALGDETKRDIAALRDEMKRDIAALRVDLTSLKEEMASVRVGVKDQYDSWFRSNEKLLYGCFAACGGALFAMVQMRVQILEGDQRTEAAAREGCVRATACCELLSGARVLTNNEKQNAELRSDGAVGQVRTH